MDALVVSGTDIAKGRVGIEDGMTPSCDADAAIAAVVAAVNEQKNRITT